MGHGFDPHTTDPLRSFSGIKNVADTYKPAGKISHCAVPWLLVANPPYTESSVSFGFNPITDGNFDTLARFGDFWLEFHRVEG